MLKRDWFAAPENEIHPRTYPAGTVLTGELLARARALGLVDEQKAEPAAPETAAKAAPPENKAARKK